ncbi:hypothetical protein TNCV_1659161 [Trichonephila clavipes]|nr:hypothetical protein TNCV_1659161 [Trichonephila clavipes]
MWLIQDRARPHRSRKVLDVMEEHFANRILALGYPETTAETTIPEVIDSTDVPTLQRVMQNFAIRLGHIIANDGKHIERAIT